jgi:hypothetical protein
MTATTPIDPRKVAYLPLSGLTPDPRNPKGHDHETIGASIGRFGVLDLIVRDERTGRIVSGHGRAEVFSRMRDRGEAPPEGVLVTPDGKDWMVPVVVGWASRTDTEAAAALIALNRTTELGGWVDDALLELLDEIGSLGPDGLTGVGYDEHELEDLRKLLAPDTDVDEWDGESGLAPREETTTIEITDPNLAAAWVAYRAKQPTDTIALAALMAAAGVPTAPADAV